MTPTNHVQAGLATVASGASMTLTLAHVHEWLSVLVTLASLAWWVRLWISNPKLKPPTLPEK